MMRNRYLNTVNKSNFGRNIIIILFAISAAWYLRYSYYFGIDSKHIPAAARGSCTFFEYEFVASHRVLKVDATQDHIYVSYASTGVVAVYNWNGEYQYSMSFFDGTNGVLSIRCQDNLLYVYDLATYEIVLDNQIIIESYAPGEGLHYAGWFDESDGLVYCSGNQIFAADGTYIMDLPGHF